MGFKRLILKVSVDVNPTEDPGKVQAAVEKMFGEITLRIVKEKEKSRLAGESEGRKALIKFHDLLRREQILDAARGVLLKGIQDNTIRFYLNKQVAYVGHISFSQSVGESPLGPIRVEIESDDPKAVVDWLTPKTA